MKTKLFLFLLGITMGLNSMAQPTPEMVRNSISQGVQSLEIQPEEVFNIENKIIDSIPVRIYYPTSKKSSEIIYNIHGGALVAGDLETHDNISRKLANASNAVVIALDYRKPTEHPFPQSIDDVYTVYNWILNNRKSITGNSNPIAIVGDSSGSLLAAALQVKLDQNGEKSEIKKAVYLNPAFDLRDPHNNYAQVVSWYLNGSEADNPLTSPFLAEDFSIFRPCLIIVNEKDLLRQQGLDFAEKLDKDGVANKVITIENEDHFGVLWAGAHPKIDKAFQKSIDFLED